MTCTILSLVAQFHWPLHQHDVSNAFLHGKLYVPVYMSQPPGFVDATASVCFTTPQILCDNMGAARPVLNPVQHSRIRHIAINLHFVHGLDSKGKLTDAYVNTQDQFMVLLTKPLARAYFLLLCSKIYMVDGMSILRDRIRKRSNI